MLYRKAIEELAKRTQTSKAEAKRNIEAVIGLIADGIITDGEVRLCGLGSFRTRVRKARRVKKPGTNEFVNVAERKVACFKPCATVRTCLNANKK